MKKWVKIIVTLFVIFAVAGGSIAYYIWNKPHRDIKDEKGIGVTAAAIFDAFNTDENKANKLYLNKAIQVTGEVSSVKKNQAGYTVVFLKTKDPVFGVNCTCKEDPGNIKPGDTITFKGICTGFLSDVVLNEGVIVK